MKNDKIIVFLGGDIFGQVGMRCITTLLPAFITRESVDFVIVNGENASAGVGLSASDARLILDSGADVITGGNHTFEKRDFWPVLESMNEVLRPANYPSAPECAIPGQGARIYEKNGFCYAVLNLQGREDMFPLDCPFRCASAQLDSWFAGESKPLVFVDFHAESNAEKEALGFYLDGKVVSVTGTHTHVQTADERILPLGTAYMSDLGMTGPVRSVIGVNPEFAIKRNITQVLYKMEPFDTRGALRGLLLEIDPATHKVSGLTSVELLEPVS